MVLKIKPVQKSRSLTSDLADNLRSQILEGGWRAGTKLPASKEIEAAAGVSRTVVREAVAVLKAEGLVESQQGVGVFVCERKRNKLFSIDEDEFSSLEDAIKILELRMAVEIEMGGMAAVNHSVAQMKEITKRLNAVNKKMKSGKDGQKEDFEFHMAIAKASGNDYFTRFIEFIGSGVIPARELIVKNDPTQKQQEFYDAICEEHCLIEDAIKSRDASRAKQALASHLGNSRERHSNIVKSLQNV